MSYFFPFGFYSPKHSNRYNVLLTRLASVLLRVGLSRAGRLSSDPGSLLSLPKCLEPNPQVWVATPYTGRASLGAIRAPFLAPEATATRNGAQKHCINRAFLDMYVL